MPRDGAGVYSTPPGTHGTPNTTILSANYNSNVDDVAADLNTPRPVVAGGTGATTAAGALTALGAVAKAGDTMTGALTPSQPGGIVGTTTNDNVNAGSVGEQIIADQMVNVPLSNHVAANVTTISLTAGDWDVDGAVQATFSTGGQGVVSSVSTVSATLPATTYAGSGGVLLLSGNCDTVVAATSQVRVSIAATTTVYLVAMPYFSGGTCNAQGTLRARRIR